MEFLAFIGFLCVLNWIFFPVTIEKRANKRYTEPLYEDMCKQALLRK